MKNVIKKINFLIVFIIIAILIIITFSIYILNNAMPKRKELNFNNLSEEIVINNSKVENLSGRVSIYFDTKADIFKAYDYYSYISGEGHGEKIFLKTYLIPEDEDSCYEIKSFCYDYSDSENLKFIASYYENFLDDSKKYKLAIYVIDTDMCYITDIEI